MIKFKKYGFAIGCNKVDSGARFLGYNHDRYDGDFYEFGFWFFLIYWTNSPYFYLTQEEMDANVEAFYQKNPNQRPKV